MIRVTALMENSPSENKTLISEHGLSFLIESKEGRFLFDCGSCGHTLENAHRLGLSLSNLDGVILSHSHYDHASGYRDLIEAGLGSRVLYTGSHFFEKKFSYEEGRYSDISAGFDKAFLDEHGIERLKTKGVRKLTKHISLICDFSRTHNFETIPERFVRLTEDGFVRDDFSDEQALVIEDEDKLRVFVGCSHPGILNILDKIHEEFGKPIEGVYGGTHLMEAGDERVHDTVKSMRKIGVKTCGFCHCTGEHAEEIIHKGGLISTCHLATGDSIFFDE